MVIKYNRNEINFKLQNIGSPKKGWFLKWVNKLSRLSSFLWKQYSLNVGQYTSLSNCHSS